MTETTEMFPARDCSIPLTSACIKEVWSHNLHEEFRTIRQLVKKYNYISVDTEFPGIVARPQHLHKNDPSFNYELMRMNVNMLKLIQLGLTFMDEEGNLPEGICTWQFNFKFDLKTDLYAEDSIYMLQQSGLEFNKHATDGIPSVEFAEVLMTSGLVLMDDVKYLGFHGSYDFGYLLRMLTDVDLPLEESDFFYYLKIYFPNIYDVKYVMKLCKELHGGLQDVAEMLGLPRVGTQHQAGSDSLLTGMAFFHIKDFFFDGDIESTNGHVHGLHLTTAPPNNENLGAEVEVEEGACALAL